MTPNERASRSCTVERAGREALDDLRRLLGMLRKDDGLRTLAPQPGLAELAALLAALRRAGAHLSSCTATANALDLTPGIDLVCYRLDRRNPAQRRRAPRQARRRHAATTAPSDSSSSSRGTPRSLTWNMGSREVTSADRAVRGRASGCVRATAGGFALRATLPLETRVPA